MTAIVISKSVYNYSQEYIHRINKYLRGSIIHTINSKILDKYTHIIYVNDIPDIQISTTKKIFLLNLEQLSIKNYLDYLYNCINKNNLTTIIDYSEENIFIMKQLCPNMNFIFFPYPIKIPLTNYSKPNDIISLLSNDYRKIIANKIKKPILNFSGMWGTRRDINIKKSKILLNIHYNDNYNIFESIRCYQALEYKTIIVSQESLHFDLNILKDYIHNCNIDKLNDSINTILSNYNVIYDKLFSPENINNINALVESRCIIAVDAINNL
jgi:hypothetical protein